MSNAPTHPSNSAPLPSDDVEAALRALSTWSGPAVDDGELARLALEEHERAPVVAGRVGFLARRGLPLAVAALITIASGLLMFTLVQSPRLKRGSAGASPKPAIAFDMHRALPSRIGVPSPASSGTNGLGGGQDGNSGEPVDIVASAGLRAGELTSDRAVIRTASIGVTVEDLSQSFIRAQGLVRTIDGEYVESSQLSAEERWATLTLRVAAARLPEVLQGVRALGEVTAESAQGSDITDQLVDLEARIRNERRIESELLELVNARKGAPLDDLMRVRSQLDQVRAGIERLEAQRERATRQVNFSAITVTLQRPADSKESAAPSEPSPLSYTTKALGNAWQVSLRAATDGIAFLILLVVGGLPWWLLFAAAGIMLRTWWRRRVAAGLA